MKLRLGEWFLLFFNIAYIAGFGTYFVSTGNYEFLWYVAVLMFFFVLVTATLPRTRFSYTILGGLSLWGFLHMAGGGIPVGEGVLYAYQVLPLLNGTGDLVLLKFDQIVHTFGFFVATLVGFHLLKPYLNERTRWSVIYVLLIFIGMGAGALNELVEFAAVLTFPQTGVGGYANTMLDLVFNTIGAVLAVCFIHLKRIS